MKISARNTLKGKVKKIVLGEVNAEITLEVAPGVEMVSVITKSSAERLSLTEGKEAHVVVKATDVIVATE